MRFENPVLKSYKLVLYKNKLESKNLLKQTKNNITELSDGVLYMSIQFLRIMTYIIYM